MGRTGTDPDRTPEGLRCAGMDMRRGLMHRLRDLTDMDMPDGDMRAVVSRRVADLP